jgi:uncharacterized repeat protein (TIGR02543 family)
MGRIVSGSVLLLLLAAFAAGSAHSRAVTVTTVTVQVVGVGRITSGPPINCGDEKTKCYAVFSGTSFIDLNAFETDGDWHFDSWENCPTPPVGDTCTVDGDGAHHDVTANFAGPVTTPSTLSVFAQGPGDDNVSAGGGEIDCNGDGTGDCEWTVPKGSVLTLFETPGGGDVFDGWDGDCTGTSAACSVEMDGNKSVNATWLDTTATVELTVTIVGSGEVEGGGIDCPSTCVSNEAQNSTVTLTATPNNGYSFTGWTGGCTGTTATCVVTMDIAQDVTATFAINPQLTVSVNGNGNVSGGSGAINCGNGGTICSATFAQNATVTLIATAPLGTTFTGWSDACGGTATTCTVSMNISKSVTANFTTGPAAGGGTGTNVLLSVSVTGNGKVTGGGINCGGGSTPCSASVALNSTITLTAAGTNGGTFDSWGGACLGGAPTCTIVMNAAKSVTANFVGGTSTFSLVVSVNGSGTVSGGGIDCGNGHSTCSTQATGGSRITLTASPATGAKFTIWGGACGGTTITCTITMDAAKSVTATFTTTPSKPTPTPTTRAVLASLGAPIVRRSGQGFAVTLRFRTTQGGLARVRGLRAGRVGASVSLRVAAGRATIGPFPVKNAGLYIFELRLGGRTLRWRVCLGRCGAAATAGAFVVTREPPRVTRSGDAWSVTLHFRENMISDGRVRALRGTRVLVNQHFLGRAGRIAVGPFLLGPGSYTLRITVTDPYGRTRTLTWIVALAR